MSHADVMKALDNLTAAVARVEKAVKSPPRTGYRPREVAEMTGIGYEAVLELIKAGELDAIQVGRLHVVTAASVERFMARTGEVIELDARRSA
jgi:excisionase family DNA binding protein